MKIASERAPLYEMLVRHANLSGAAFHVPGHKQRAAWGDNDADDRFRSILPLDLTELADTDDLHHPSGPIEEAQRLAAACFGSEETRFLVGGSTVGNLAMILGTAASGELLIVQRNVHRSVLHGLMLAGVRAVLLQPETDEKSGLAVIPSVGSIREALSRYTEAKGVVLCSPNYYGMGGDLRTIIDTCHDAGIPVLVDEAHGPHFGFHPLFPSSALQAGADVAVQSAHKMLGSMTMTAMLHMQGAIVNREAIRQALRMVQSSSPSFPLLASLDLARKQLHVEGPAAFRNALEAVSVIRDGISGTRFRLIGNNDGDNDQNQAVRQDPLKLVLYDALERMDGFKIRDELAERGCIAEMADSRYAVLALGIGSRSEDGETLLHALKSMAELDWSEDGRTQPTGPFRGVSEQVDIPAPVLFNRMIPEIERVPLEESVGRTAGEWVVPYPPGIPELYPGEQITERCLERLHRWRSQGADIQGVEDRELKWIRVFAKSAV